MTVSCKSWHTGVHLYSADTVTPTERRLILEKLEEFMENQCNPSIILIDEPVLSTNDSPKTNKWTPGEDPVLDDILRPPQGKEEN